MDDFGEKFISYDSDYNESKKSSDKSNDSIAIALLSIIMILLISIFLIISWVFLHKSLAITFSVITGFVSLIGIIYLSHKYNDNLLIFIGSNILFWLIIISIPLALIAFTIIAWINFNLLACIGSTAFTTKVIVIEAFIYYKFFI